MKIGFLNKHALLKNIKTKISHIFRTERDIQKNWNVLNSAYLEEQAVEVSFAGIKGLMRIMTQVPSTG